MLCLRPLSNNLRVHQGQPPFARCPCMSVLGWVLQESSVWGQQRSSGPHRPRFVHVKGGLCTGTLVPVVLEREKWSHSRATQLSFPIVSSDFLENPPKNSRLVTVHWQFCRVPQGVRRMEPLGVRRVELVFLPWVGKVLLGWLWSNGVPAALLVLGWMDHGCSGLKCTTALACVWGVVGEHHCLFGSPNNTLEHTFPDNAFKFSKI